MSIFDIFKQIEKDNNSKTLAPVEYIICGLGNPGTKYENTRHNVGWMTIDDLAKKQNADVKKLKFKSLTADGIIAGKRCLLMKPTTFMNKSGEAVIEAMNFYKIPPERVILAFDDISLPVGKTRIRLKGSDGGHNGMKNIILNSGSDMFPRVKIGIGEKPHPEMDLADWVLSGFTKQEGELLEQALTKAIAAIELLVQGKSDEAMNKYNR